MIPDGPILPDGLDRIGPFHPYIVVGGILLVDLFIILLVFSALMLIGDKVEDVIWPGGKEWVDL